MLMSIAAHCMKEGSSQTKCYSIRTKLVRSFLYAPLEAIVIIFVVARLIMLAACACTLFMAKIAH